MMNLNSFAYTVAANFANDNAEAAPVVEAPSFDWKADADKAPAEHKIEKLGKGHFVIWNVKGKDRTFRGQEYKAEPDFGHHAEIIKGQAIRLFGSDERVKYIDKQRAVVVETYDKALAVGAEAEYHSWNLCYLGEIVGITEKSVAIVPELGGEGKKRLTVEEFSRRNRWKTVEEKRAHNLEESYCI